MNSLERRQNVKLKNYQKKKNLQKNITRKKICAKILEYVYIQILSNLN